MALTDKQLQIRAQGVGGSELGAILGLSAFSGPLEVQTIKANPEGGDGFKQTPAMMMGTMLEDAVARRWDALSGVASVHAPVIGNSGDYSTSYAEHICDGTFRNKQYPHLLVTPDFVVPRLLIREIKVVGPWSGANNFSLPGQPQRIPPSYDIQVQAQMGTLDIPRAELIVLVQREKLTDKFINWLFGFWSDPACKVHFDAWADMYVADQEPPRVYPINYDPEKFHKAGAAVEAFWANHVVTGKPDPSWKPFKRPRTYTPGKVRTINKQASAGGWL